MNLKITAYKERKETLGNVYLTNLMKSDLKVKHEWLSELNSQSLQSALCNLDTAYTNFFRDTKAVFASVLVDTSIQELPMTPVQDDTALGIDLGIKSLAVCSDGRTFDNAKNLQGGLKRLALLQKRLSHKQKGSSNRNKARIRVARLQEYIANCRKDNLHKITHALTHDSQVLTLCMENLNVKDMQRNHYLAQSVGDVFFGMFLTLLEYKCSWYGVNLIKIDRFASSSKICVKCGYVYKGLKLSERSWTCPECGTHHDRDFKSNDRKKQEKRGGIGISEAAKSLV